MTSVPPSAGELSDVTSARSPLYLNKLTTLATGVTLGRIYVNGYKVVVASRGGMTDFVVELGMARTPYVIILICEEIDTYGHNAVFAEEISAALRELGLASRIVDYRRKAREVHDALRDESCAFFICFNGFGSELAVPGNLLGSLVSAFSSYQKLLFDLMHDCPSHEAMAHQVLIKDRERQVLLTDYGYVEEAHELGFASVRFVASITFPITLPAAVRTRKHRPIQILLPVQLPRPSLVDVRLLGGDLGSRKRVFREIYDFVTDQCIADLRIDPRTETRRACREAGIAFDARDVDFRFLLTCILDRTKFSRRHDLLVALRGLPVTILTDTHAEKDVPEGFATVPARSFRDLLKLMSESASVICPLPHMTGFHERALGAFTAGAAVLAAPNDLLETHFRHAHDMLTYQSTAELVELIPAMLSDPARLQAIARSGQGVALEQFAPQRLAVAMLSSWQLRRTATEEGDFKRFGMNLVRRRMAGSDAGLHWVDSCFFAKEGINTKLLREIPRDISLPSGWMSAFDLQVLYNLAIACASPFLEVGPWIGRSTSAICAGIRDSAAPDKTFDVLDFGICGVEEWKERFGYVPDFDLPDHKKGRVGETITAPGGTIAVLIENLRLNGLLQFTTSITRGDWITCPHDRKYRFVFIDAVHNQQEADRHLPKLRQMLADDALVVIDDVVAADFADRVCDLLGTTSRVLTHSIDGQNKLMLTRLGAGSPAI